MEDSKPQYRVPEDFNPHCSMNTIRGLTDAVHRFTFEGPGTERVIPHGDRAGYNGLLELLQAEVHALHDYLREIENRTTINLPLTDAEFDAVDVRNRDADGVKEPKRRYG